MAGSSERLSRSTMVSRRHTSPLYIVSEFFIFSFTTPVYNKEEAKRGLFRFLFLFGSYNPGQNYLRIFTPPCTLCNTTTLFQKQLICGTKFPFPQVNVVSYKCLRIRVASEHTTTLLPRGGGREDAVQREC